MKYKHKKNCRLNKTSAECFGELLKKKMAAKWGEVQTIVNELREFFSNIKGVYTHITSQIYFKVTLYFKESQARNYRLHNMGMTHDGKMV